MRLLQEREEKKAEEERKLRKEEMRLMLEREERKADEDSRREDFRMRIEEDRREEVKMEKDRCIEEQRRVEDAAERRHRETLEDSEKNRREAAERENTRDMKMKRGADILRGCMYRMGDDVLEMPMFFENADRHFESNGIEDDLRLALINPYLSEKAWILLTRLSRDETDTYDKIKKALLTEFRLTPQKYRDMFRNATKERNESHVQFATRLLVLWKYYMNSREINEDYDRLCELMVVDKFKNVLLPNAREFIRNRKGEEWNPVQKIARMVDTYVNDFPENRMREENKGTGFNKSIVDRSKISENREVEKVWRNEKPFQNKNTGGKEAEKQGGTKTPLLALRNARTR